MFLDRQSPPKVLKIAVLLSRRLLGQLFFYINSPTFLIIYYRRYDFRKSEGA